MGRSAPQPDARTRLLALPWDMFAIAFAYFVAGKLALLLAIPPGYAAPVWPAAGIALAGLLLCGRRAWPGVWLGSALTNVDASFDATQVAFSLAVASAIGVGATLQALLGASLIRRFVGFPTALLEAHEVGRFLLLGGPLASLVSAGIGVTVLTVSGLAPLDAAPFSGVTWWVGDTIGVLLATPLVLMALAEPREVWRPRRVSVGVPLLVTFAVTVGVFAFANHWEHVRARGEFEHQAEELSHRVETNVRSYAAVLRSVASLYVGSESVERDEFRVFVESLVIHHPGIQAVGWTQRVLHDEREAFEASVRHEGFPDFRITETNGRFEVVPAARRDEYVPVTYIEPFEGNESALGFDAAWGADRGETQAAARDSGEIRVTGPLRLVQDEAGGVGVVAYVPVYRNGAPRASIAERRANLRGYIAGVFRVDDVMAAALDGADREGVALALVDERAGDRLWGEASAVEAADGHVLRHPLAVAGIDWTLHASRDGAYLVAHRSLNAWIVLLGGLLLDSLLGSFLLILTGRAARVEALVAKRTVELSHAKNALERQLRDRIEAERALRASESQFRLVTESANDAIVIADGDGRVIRWNHGAERCFGYAESEVLGKPLTRLIPERHRDAHDRGIHRLAHGGEARLLGRLVEVEGLRKDGSEFPVEVSLSRWTVPEGTFYSGVLRDVTDHHRAAEELRLALENAEAANHAKGEFLANMSHEIRTPMNAVIAMTGLLRDTRLDDEQREFVETVRASGEYLLSVINDILDFSKIDAGYLQLEQNRFDLRETVAEAVELVAPQAERVGIALRQSVAAEVPETIHTDAGRLRQVLVNLLSNAVKFTSEGSVDVGVDAREVARGRWELHFSVRDTGIGIPQDRIEGLFDPFTQADGSITRRFGGTGLGLAISQKLCALLGGRIWAESREGEGSTFHFTIVADASATQDAAPALAPSSDETPLDGLRVLVAEDSAVNQQVARLLLGKLGVEDVDAVGNGYEALEALERRSYDVVLMDVQMPEMDGLAATEAIHARWKPPSRPTIVAMTAHALVGDRERCLGAGMDGYVSKPVQLPVLAAELRRVRARA